MDVRRRRCAAVVHRTFLARNGRGMAPVEPTKALRSALKVLLRRFGLRCIEVHETVNAKEDAHE
jgi:hypothetical protein